MKVNEITFSEKEVKNGQLTKFLQLLLEKQISAEPIGDMCPKYDIRIWYDGMTTVLEYVELLEEQRAYTLLEEVEEDYDFYSDYGSWEERDMNEQDNSRDNS